jgi:hypothetical protein
MLERLVVRWASVCLLTGQPAVRMEAIANLASSVAFNAGKSSAVTTPPVQPSLSSAEEPPSCSLRTVWRRLERLCLGLPYRLRRRVVRVRHQLIQVPPLLPLQLPASPKVQQRVEAQPSLQHRLSQPHPRLLQLLKVLALQVRPARLFPVPLLRLLLHRQVRRAPLTQLSLPQLNPLLKHIPQLNHRRRLPHQKPQEIRQRRSQAHPNLRW